MSDRPVVQVVIVPHRPVHDEAELDNELNQAFALVLRYLLITIILNHAAYIVFQV